jgi:iron complex outermembrane receptor protein
VTVRKEVTATYKSPVLFSVGTVYSVTSFYKIKTNASRNFRIPTFNDLYWQGSGNNDLKPESAYQAEIGNEFKWKNTTFSATGYYMKIQDLLRWSPGNNGVWSPNNVAKVTTYGGEFLGNYKKNFGTHFFDFSTTYGYTFSKDEKNDKQLIYVPNHKFTAAVAYSYQKITAHFQYLYNGEVFTSSDNFYSLDDYVVSNVGFGYDFGKKEALKLGVTVLNVFNEKYQSVATRPMPGRNYSMYLTFKF